MHDFELESRDFTRLFIFHELRSPMWQIEGVGKFKTLYKVLPDVGMIDVLRFSLYCVVTLLPIWSVFAQPPGKVSQIA